MENPELYMKTSTYPRVWETKISNFNMIIKKNHRMKDTVNLLGDVTVP